MVSTFFKLYKNNLYNDLINHSCKFVTSKFTAFSDGKVVTNNISESMNFVIKSITENKQLPIDSIIMVFKQVQDVYSYDFLRGFTGFGNFQLKTEFTCLKKRRTDIVLYFHKSS